MKIEVDGNMVDRNALLSVIENAIEVVLTVLEAESVTMISG
jgi:hypothetical protein